jgi:hypothetical protein
MPFSSYLAQTIIERDSTLDFTDKNKKKVLKMIDLQINIDLTANSQQKKFSQ